MLGPVTRPRRVARQRSRVGLAASAAAVTALASVAVIVLVGSGDSREGTGSGGSGVYRYAVRPPGPGEPAPPLDLPATGGRYDLAGFSGKEPVLLFFQAGPTCEPCWAQLRAMARHAGFGALPLGSVASIATAPLKLLEEKVSAERISYPVLADSRRAFSRAYNTLGPRARRGGRDGQTFILVGRDGRILWRADYGPAASTGTVVPVAVLVRELRKALEGGS